MTDQRNVSAVGIDLGTTFSVVACLDKDNRPITIPNSEGDLTTPSVVYFDKASAVVGKEAVKVAEYEPERIARFAKRDMGGSKFHRVIRGEYLPPEVLQALVLRKLKTDTELRVGPVDKVVVTVPAYFNEPRRKATQDAGYLAGLDVIDIINEPTAAAISYGMQRGFLDLQGESQNDELILVYDLGGGTFDVTLMEISGRNYNAVATGGDVRLGGTDWDHRIVDYVGDQFQQEFGIDPRKDDAAVERLMQEAEDAKRSLTARSEVSIFFAHEGERLRVTFNRNEFESMTGDLLDRTHFTIRTMLREAGYAWKDVTRLLLVGGSTRMPMVQEMLQQESGLTVDRSLSPDEAVAHGAALYAGFLLDDEDNIDEYRMFVKNVCSHDLGVLGVERSTGRKRRHTMIARNTQLPATGHGVFTTYKDNQDSVMVTVVEGGDDSGLHATEIGKCIVSGFPPGLPAHTPVEVMFKYGTNGRLSIYATVPSIDLDAHLTIDRSSGLSAEDMESWKIRVLEGMPDTPETEAHMQSALSAGESVENKSPSPQKPTSPVEENSAALPAISRAKPKRSDAQSGMTREEALQRKRLAEQQARRKKAELQKAQQKKSREEKKQQPPLPVTEVVESDDGVEYEYEYVDENGNPINPEVTEVEYEGIEDESIGEEPFDLEEPDTAPKRQRPGKEKRSPQETTEENPFHIDTGYADPDLDDLDDFHIQL